MISLPLKGFCEVILHRPAFSNEIDVYILQDFYTVLQDELEMWLLHICDREMTIRIVNYLWNMRCLKFLVDQKRFVPFSKKEIEAWQQDKSKR